MRMKPGLYKVTHAERTLLESCQYDTSLWFRFKGLMFTPELPANHGLLLTPCNSVHMFFMRYALDIVFLDKESRIVRICPTLKPWRVSPIVVRAHSVLECPSGLAEKSRLQIGDPLHFDPMFSS